VSPSRQKVILQRLVGGEVVAKQGGSRTIDSSHGLLLTISTDGRRLYAFVSGGGGDTTSLLSIRAHGLKPGRVGFAVKGRPRGPASGAVQDIEIVQ